MAAGLNGPVLSRLAGLGVLLVLGVMILARGLHPAAGGVLAFLHLVDLVFHEAGHVVFGLFGRFLGVLGGSLGQVVIPAVCTVHFLRRGQQPAAAVALFWVGESLTDVAIYAADGRDMALPLLAEGLIHDWNWILSALSLREHAPAIGRTIYAAGVAVLAGALLLLAQDLRRIWTGAGSTGVVSSRGRLGDRSMP